MAHIITFERLPFLSPETQTASLESILRTEDLAFDESYHVTHKESKRHFMA